MPILPLVEKKPLDADSIISPVVEIPENRKLSVTPSRSPIDNPSRYHPSSTLAPGIDPSALYASDTKAVVASSLMHTYPPPQVAPLQNNQVAVSNGYVTYAAGNTGNLANQTYPVPQLTRKPVNGFVNGLTPSQSYHPSSVHNTNDPYGISPVSSVQQQQQQQIMYTDSPIDTMAFPAYYTPEPQNLSNDIPGMGYNPPNGARNQQQGTFTAMQYLTAQHNYNYQG